MPWRRWISLLVAGFTGLVLFALILPAIQQAREAAWRTESRDKLHNIGVALHNYHDVHGALPPGGVVSEAGEGHHGWMTYTLFYVDKNPVYPLIDFDRPWNDPLNDYIFCAEIPIYQMPGVAEIATTEGYALAHCQGNPDLMHRNSHVALGDLTAGLDNTWLVGETAGRYQPWGYPFNWHPLGNCLNCGPESFGRPSGTGAFLLFADGSVRFISNDVTSDVLNSMDAAGPQPDPDAVSAPVRRFECVTQIPTRNR